MLNLFSHHNTEHFQPFSVPELPESLRSSHINDDEVKEREKKALYKQLERFDENVKHAILLRMEKDEKTEFYRRLETLTERIKVYKNVYYCIYA